MPLPAALIPIIMAASGFVGSGGIDKLIRQFDPNKYNDPSLMDWATTGAFTGLGASSLGSLGGNALLKGSQFAAPRLGKAALDLNKLGLQGLKWSAPRSFNLVGSSPLLRQGLGYSLAGGLDPTARLVDQNPYNNPKFTEFILPLLLGVGARKAPNFGPWR